MTDTIDKVLKITCIFAVLCAAISFILIASETKTGVMPMIIAQNVKMDELYNKVQNERIRDVAVIHAMLRSIETPMVFCQDCGRKKYSPAYHPQKHKIPKSAKSKIKEKK